MHRFRFWLNLIHGWFIFSLLNAVILYLWILNEPSEDPFIDRLLDMFGAYLLLSLPGFILYAIANRLHLMFPFTYNPRTTQLLNLLFFTVLVIAGYFGGAFFFERPMTWDAIVIAILSSVVFFAIPYFRNSLFNYQ